MYAVFEVLAAFFFAAGLVILGWYLFGRLLTPAGGLSGGVCAVVPGRGEGANLEGDVRRLLWEQGDRGVRYPVIVADGGLDDQGRAAAAALADRYPQVEICPADRLGAYITEHRD